MVARLVRIRHEHVASTRGILPHDVPSARTATPATGPEPEGKRDGKAPRPRHAARHARTSGPAAAQHTSLSIRSAERRRWSADLARPEVTGLVIHGLGGVGKSTLAAQIAARLSRLAPERAVTTASGEVSAASLVAQPAQTDLVVLDSFEDNLACESGLRTVRDPALASLLSAWTGKLLITCGTAFSLPPGDRDRFVFRHLGPLTRSGAAELAMSLTTLRALGERDRDLAWRLAVGHPRTMEYLDALLAAGLRLADLAERLTATIQARTGQAPAATEPTELSEAVAEVTAQAVGQQLFGELFGRLSEGAQDLLVRASVFRTPVAPGVLAARPAHIAECEAAGLLTPRPGRELTVHRWTAGQLHHRLAEAGRTAQLAAAHRQAAGYWHARTATPQLGPRAQLEAAYHLHQAGELAARAPATIVASSGRIAPKAGHDHAAASHARRRRVVWLASAAGAAAVVLAVEATNGLSVSHLASADRPDHSAAPAPLTQAGAVRDHAAAWVASQVSAGAIVSCDPVMCSDLVRHGFPAANLLVLGPGAGDPLGSGVVLATAAVRSMFGSRLATVYAPQTLASFGTGTARIDVRVVAAGGAAAYRTALAADVRARRAAGLQLLADPRVSGPAEVRADLAAGRVDARLLIAMAAMAESEPLRIVSFGGGDPGASPGTPLRTAEITAPPANAQAMLAFVRAQRSPYLPVRSDLSHGVLTVEFAAPAPLGLLQAPP
ncbi:MAG TPA: hypothetical protein VKU77_05515 [Streptosporangiaceae bacterium]|nr:hypothetical protein [Streptosporangiaceae bacterium]